MLWLWLSLACSPVAQPGIYKSGPNAIARYTPNDASGVLAWGPSGTVRRIGTPASGGFQLFGESGPLWVVDRELPAQEKRAPVTAAIAERAGFRMREVLGGQSTIEIDPARSAGVSVRSLVKVRRHLAPPVYVAVATKGAHGIPDATGQRSPVLKAEDCTAAIAVFDAELARVIDSKVLPAAATTCAVPSIAGPVDLDGNDHLDVLVHGQDGKKGFRGWFEIGADGKLKPGPTDQQMDIP